MVGIGRRLAASYEASSAVYKPRVHTAIQETQAESFYADNGFIEFSMLEGLGIKQPEAYVRKALPEGVSLETVHCHPQTVENMDGENPDGRGALRHSAVAGAHATLRDHSRPETARKLMEHGPRARKQLCRQWIEDVLT